MKVTAQTVSITDIPAGLVPEEVAASPLIGQLLTREDGVKRFVYFGNNDALDSDEEVLSHMPSEVVPGFLLAMGMYQVFDAAKLEGATIRVLAELPSFNTEDEAA